MSRSLVALVVVLTSLATGCLTKHRDDETVACSPGQFLTVACDRASGVGRCTGDPVLRVCDGLVSVSQCAATGEGQLAMDDDSGDGLCPLTTLVCPPTGLVTVVSYAFSSTSDFRCQWEIEEGASGAPAPLVEDAGR